MHIQPYVAPSCYPMVAHNHFDGVSVFGFGSFIDLDTTNSLPKLVADLVTSYLPSISFSTKSEIFSDCTRNLNVLVAQSFRMTNIPWIDCGPGAIKCANELNVEAHYSLYETLIQNPGAFNVTEYLNRVIETQSGSLREEFIKDFTQNFVAIVLISVVAYGAFKLYQHRNKNAPNAIQ